MRTQPATKFRAPRLRHDIVERQPLLRRAHQLALNHRLTLVCAPAGFGKSTLLAQLAAAGGAQAVWLSLDEDDNDANRLFASLLFALRDLELEWEVEPKALASQVDGFGEGTRAAAAGLVNALASFERERLLFFIDDLHRVDDPDALRLLDLVIERLPPAVGFVVGSRTEPALSLARWRVRGELGELHLLDLQFDEQDAARFAAARLANAATPELVREALARSDGWAAGLQLIFGAAPAPDRTAPRPAATQTARRHLFDFFAHEVLAGLPDELCRFALQCSVLAELTPPLCAALTGRADAHRLLDELYRRNLFLVALDEEARTLRFHDLFRDFLASELARRWPQELPDLHARAAQSEPVPSRAVAHWLKAQRWDEALRAMAACAKALLAEGGHGTLVRWLDQLPDEVRRSHPQAAHLRGQCAWAHWDWLTVRPLLEQACAGYREAGDSAGYIEALGLLGASCNGVGDLETAARVLAEADALELQPASRVPFSTLRAWHALAQGRCAEAVPWLHATAQDVQRELSSIYPDIIDLAHGHHVGIPGALVPLRRLQGLARELRRREETHWSSAVVAQGAWLEFWQGHREAAIAALEEQRSLQQHLPAWLALLLSSHHLQAFHLAVEGRHAEAVQEAQAMLRVLQEPVAHTLKATWGDAYLHVLARVHWIGEDTAALQALLPAVTAQPPAWAWPAQRMACAMVRGQAALLAADLAAAEPALEEAVALHAQARLPGFLGDPRPALAMLRLAQGDRDAARQAMQPVFDEALQDDAIGLLLLEPRARLAPLLDLAPAPMQALRARLATWHGAAGAGTAPAADDWQGLSAREREVLVLMAEGLSNKLLARRLDLSLHTVKRHVANIFDKIGAASRVQAVAWLRDREG
jgi:LuxR family maltose regulon positive regulatory protein